MPPTLPDSSTVTKLSARSFEAVRRLVYDKAGIDLQQGKEHLVASRLAKLVRIHNLSSCDAYVDRLLADRTTNSLMEMIDAISTNHTSFLREPAHFDFLQRNILPKLAGRQEIRIWCAAAATGEEPYSLLFSAIDTLGLSASNSCRILATDISGKALTTARNGIYSGDRLDPLPKEWLPRYFLRGEAESKGLYRVKPEWRNQIEFRKLNLIEPIHLGGQFPLISCRNVMIYFDRQTQQRVVESLVTQLEPGGFLFIGHSDAMTGKHPSLIPIQPAIFQKALVPGYEAR
ncbi:MAG TPA: protein-glutamate O-methyltransferase CheR [Bryobacteraceae bacterium]|jgi:chemotaxis protein methyltransferase CheR|nr:protein-glutamate O-methyltransferase CheR [Bryobacteraceae bacterium]